MSFVNHSQYQKVAPARIDQRREERHPVILQRASLRAAKNQPEEARLVDLSSFGCRLEVQETYRAGTRIMLGFLGREPMQATTIWCRDGQLGCRFEDAIDLCLFRALTIRAV